MSERVSDPTGNPAPEPAEPEDDGWSWREVFRLAPRWVRVPVYLLSAVAGFLVLLLVLGFVVVRYPLPQADGTTVLAGLDAEVEVVRDVHGIPQIYGETDADLMRAQGYVHAQERFFQMDLRRHATAGRLSELFGERTLEQDKMVRTMGWRRIAEEEWGLLRVDTKEALTAYADGVNAYLAERGTAEIAAEYSVLRLTGLGYHPEEWTPVDSLAWLKAMAWDLRGNMDDEMDRVLLSLDLSDDEIAQLHPAYDARARTPIVTSGAVVEGAFDQDASTTGSIERPVAHADGHVAAQVAAYEAAQQAVDAVGPLIGHGSELGSNSWVVSGEHTASGAPLLANDPHLGISQPGVWMQVGLHCTERSADCTLDTAGFSFAGVPGVVIGHNADIAWGFTNLGPDVTDLFLEQVSGDDAWIQDGLERPLTVRRETIKVRGADDFDLRIRESAHGPLISDVSREMATVGANAPTEVPGERGTGYAVALAWTALTPSPTADAILLMNRASDWEEFREAAASFAVPAQNLVYADREGHIGYQAPGLVPIRKPGNDGRMPAEGWISANDWTGDHVDFEALPSVLDPEEGYIVTANQAVVDDSYPFFLTGDWDHGYRSQRIRDQLENRDGLTVEDMTRIQTDTTHPIAARLVPLLLEIDLPGGYESQGQDLLAGWDHTQDPDSAAAAYFNLVWREVLSGTFDDELRPDSRPDGDSRWVRVVDDLLDEPSASWWDDVSTEEVETRDDVLRSALLAARDDATTLLSVNPDDWSWGQLHRMDLRHDVFGDVAPLTGLFNSSGWRAGGGSATVDATGWDASVGFGVTSAPSMRMVVSLEDFDDSVWIDLTGVSGHPASRHYSDQTKRWVSGDYLDWTFSREAVDRAADERLTLVPTESQARTGR
ncbi:MAG: penicillin acylase family protein [Nocardioides sp.]|uniref:penicillin acylase family protein n=1 Tax=Nocardioides sp. TaxID=35761 RepID=UPI003EFE6BAB